jgi:hypothetical protein
MPDKYLTVDPAIEIFECLRRRAERLWPGFGSRQCVREEYVEAEGTYVGAVSYGYVCKEWTFHYSDGEIETVTTRTPKS